MVQGVKLALLYQLQQVWEFKGGHPLRLEQGGKPGHKVVDVGHVGQHVVGGHQIRRVALIQQFLRQCGAKKTFYHRKAFGPCRIGGAGGGFHAQTRNAMCCHVLQQVAVVGSHLHHLALMVQAPALHHLGYIGLRMCQPAAGVRAEVSVFAVKQFVRLGKVFGLHQPAFCTHQHAQRVPTLWGMQIAGIQISVGRRCGAQIGE